MRTPREALLEHTLRQLVAAVAEAPGSRDESREADARVRGALAGARTLLSPPEPHAPAGADARWFAVEAGDYWGCEPLRCPACGGRETFWARLSVMLGPGSHPRVILPIVHEPATPVECSRCVATAPYNDFLPPWSDFPARSCTCDGLLCVCALPLTDADRAAETQFMVDWFAAGLESGG
jgi:hypothetical protein